VLRHHTGERRCRCASDEHGVGAAGGCPRGRGKRMTGLVERLAVERGVNLVDAKAVLS
jgi:hypothetical protein